MIILAVSGRIDQRKGKSEFRESNWKMVIEVWVRNNGGQNWRLKREDGGKCTDSGDILEVVCTGHTEVLNGKRVIKNKSYMWSLSNLVSGGDFI